MAKVPRSERKRRIDPLLDRVGVLHRADQQVGKYSKGMLQRLGIAQALINDPEMVVLDEPTDGLDPVGRREVRELLLELKQRGKTVFLNSHLLSELETVCDRVSILMDGLVARQGRLNELTEATFEYRIAAEGDLAPLREKIESAGARLDGNSIVLPGRDRSKLNELIDLLRTGGHLIESVTPHRFSLEDIFLDATGGTAKGRGAPPVARPAARRK
jgi:ABC-2 type transport system ATP-binding protein